MEGKVVKRFLFANQNMRASFRLAILITVAAGALADLIAKPAARRSQPKLQVVIDASHDGGAWWFPQGPPPFDPKKPHQGVALADYLKGRGWQVIEIQRETKISNQLKRAAIVVRIGEWGTYERSEVAAYREFVRNGGRLLLLQGYVRDEQVENDAVAEQFGVRFEGIVSGHVFRAANAGAFTLDFIEVSYQIGSVVVKSPKSTQPLAYLNDGRLAMGVFRYGRGRVVFLSSVFPILNVPQPFARQLFDELARPAVRKRS
jgi:hypothetical protein